MPGREMKRGGRRHSISLEPRPLGRAGLRLAADLPILEIGGFLFLCERRERHHCRCENERGGEREDYPAQVQLFQVGVL